jgi:hypothetical protein
VIDERDVHVLDNLQTGSQVVGELLQHHDFGSLNTSGGSTIRSGWTKVQSQR